MTARSQSVPKKALKIYDTVVALTDAFCSEHLNDEYRSGAFVFPDVKHGSALCMVEAIGFALAFGL